MVTWLEVEESVAMGSRVEPGILRLSLLAVQVGEGVQVGDCRDEIPCILWKFRNCLKSA